MENRKISNVVKYFVLSISVVLIVSVSIFYLLSCGAGEYVGEADKVLTSFAIIWPGGFEYKCGSKQPLSVTINALDQDGGLFSWNGIVSIIPTNDSISVNIEEAELENGTVTIDLSFTHTTTEILETSLKLSNGTTVITLETLLSVYPHVAGVSLDQSSLVMMEGDTVQLTVTVTPEDAWNKAVSWDSGNEAVVSVDANGLVIANSPGEATITVMTEDGSSTDNCEVLVTIISWQTMLGGISSEYGYSIQ